VLKKTKAVYFHSQPSGSPRLSVVSEKLEPEFYASHPDEFSLGTINNKSFRQTQLVYYVEE